MTIKSMTGFGQGRASSAEGMFTVQIQAVNRKYLEISVNIDREFLELENPVRQRVSKYVHRGRVNVFVQHEAPAEQHSRVVLNKRLAKEYLAAFHDLQKEFRLGGQVDLSNLLNAKDVVQVLETHPDKEKSVPVLFRALGQALQRLDIMRVREGKSLERDFQLRLRRLFQELKAIKRQGPVTLKNYQAKWQRRANEMQSQGEPARQDNQIAAFAEKVDVTEEIVRFESHLKQFSEILRTREPKGKPLDFLVQEMTREVNTIGSKANDLVISRRVITVKSELEKVREQVQNIE